MASERNVALYGDTVLLAGIGRSLAACPRLHLTSLDPNQDTAAQLAALRPCALILDLTLVSTETALALARGCPDLLLIGLEPGGEGLVVLSGERAGGLSMEALVHLIELGVPAGGPASGCHKGGWPQGDRV